MSFNGEIFPPTIESDPNPDIDWDKIKERIREIYAEDDKRIQEENADWLEKFKNKLSEEDKKTKKTDEFLEEIRKEKEAEERRKEEENEKDKARKILEEWIKKIEKERLENDPTLEALRRMAKEIESGQERFDDERL